LQAAVYISVYAKMCLKCKAHEKAATFEVDGSVMAEVGKDESLYR